MWLCGIHLLKISGILYSCNWEMLCWCLVYPYNMLIHIPWTNMIIDIVYLNSYDYCHGRMLLLLYLFFSKDIKLIHVGYWNIYWAIEKIHQKAKTNLLLVSYQPRQGVTTMYIDKQLKCDWNLIFLFQLSFQVYSFNQPCFRGNNNLNLKAYVATSS